MAELYAKLVIAKKRTLESVPKNLKDEVIQLIEELSYGETTE